MPQARDRLSAGDSTLAAVRANNRNRLEGAILTYTRDGWDPFSVMLRDFISQTPLPHGSWMAEPLVLGTLLPLCLKRGDAMRLITFLQENDFELVSAPIITALHVAITGNEDLLELVEPEIRAAARLVWTKYLAALK